MTLNEKIELWCQINEADEWEPIDIENLMKETGLMKEYQEADGETFEAIIEKAMMMLECSIREEV